MFSIFVNGQALYHSQYQEEEVLVLSPKCKREIGKTGTLEFIIMPNHYLYGNIQELVTRVTAYMGDEEIFRGRVLTATVDFFRQMTVRCEGDLAYLLDSLQPPRKVTMTLSNYFQQIINEHNIQVEPEKRFTRGIVDIPGITAEVEFANTTYRDTRESIDSDLIGQFGGILRTRRVGEITYLDYIKEYEGANTQDVEFSVNLIDLTEDVQSSEVYTVLLPTGEYQEPAVKGNPAWPLTIESVNGGSKLLENTTGIAKYGRIVKTEHFEKITDAAALKTAAEAYFTRGYREPKKTFTVQAIDLYLFDATLEQFTLGKKIRLVTAPHDIDLILTCLSISYDFENPENTEIVIGLPDEDQGTKTSNMAQSLSQATASTKNTVVQQLKYYSEGADLAKIEAKKIQLIAEDLDIKTQTMSIMAGDIASHGTLITQNKDAITLEASRATAAEGDLSGRITVEADKIEAEVTRATAAEGDLSGRITVEADKIAAEVTRATAAEGDLSGRITVEADKIAAEVTRATAAEGDLSGRITVEADKIAAEVTRATAEEAALSGRITVEADKIAAEVTRAIAEEGALSGRITVEADRITSEVARSTSAEGTLSSRITQTESDIDLRVTKDGVITSINVAPGTVKIDADKLDVSGVITAGNIVVQSELSAERARITNLTTGLSTAGVLKANYLESTGNLKVGGTTTTEYLVVNGSGSIPILTVNTQLTAGDLSATTGTFTTLKYGTTDVAARFTGIDTRITNLSSDISTSLTDILTGPSIVYNSDRLDGKHSTDFLAATAMAADSSKLGGESKSYFATAGHNHQATYSPLGHDHDTVYLKTTAMAADSSKLGGESKSYFATAAHNHQATYSALGHNHDTVYLKTTATAADSSKLGGKAATDYSLATHNHSGTYSEVGHGHTKAAISDFPTRTSASFVTDVTRSIAQGVFVKALSPYSTGYALTGVTLTVTKETYYFYT